MIETLPAFVQAVAAAVPAVLAIAAVFVGAMVVVFRR